METWKPLKGYEDLYLISTLGNVIGLIGSRKHKAGTLLKLNMRPNGYTQVWLNKDNKRKMRKVHQLVMETFGPPKPSDKYEPHHKNYTRDDNNITNLEWKTHKENLAMRAPF